MAKQILTEEKISKFFSLILGAIIGGKTDTVTSKVSQDKELVKRIKDVDKSYKNFKQYLKSKYGKEEFDAIEKQTITNLRKKGYKI
jgi:hypothetical protein